MITQAQALAVAAATQDAYSFEAYGEQGWRGCALLLRTRGLDKFEIEAVLRSKHMRWAADDAGKTKGCTSADLERHLANPRTEFTHTAIAALVQQTFGV